MSILFSQFCTDHGVPIAMEGKNISAGGGWMQIRCPLCGDPSQHLGFHPEANAFKCWRCGKRTAREILTALSPLPWREICQKYMQRTAAVPKAKKERRTAKAITLPKEFKPLQDQHKKYLQKRGYDWETLVDKYNLLGTGPLGKWKNRIIIPVTHDGEIVSYTSRDMTDRSDERYKACPAREEGRNIKACLYGLDRVKGDTVVVVEGTTDVWRLGDGAVATFGTEVTSAQRKLLQRFRRISVMFDREAMAAAENLAEDLAMLSTVEIVCIEEDDPGSMSDQKAKRIMKRLLKED